MYSISIFLFYILLIVGAYAPNAPPLPTGLHLGRVMGLLQLRFEHDSSTIRVRFEHDSATTRY